MGVGGQCHALAMFSPGNRPSTHSTIGWMGPRTGLDGCMKSCPQTGFDPRTVQPVACHYTELPAANNANIFWKCDSLKPNTNVQLPEPNYTYTHTHTHKKWKLHSSCLSTTHITNVQLYQTHCSLWRCVTASVVQNSWSCPTMFPEWPF